MAILVNMGQRGFILKEGLLLPGQSIAVDIVTAEMLSRSYPKELKVIVPEKVKIEETEEETAKAPKKRSYKRKAK